jgi:hypothetical protein
MRVNNHHRGRGLAMSYTAQWKNRNVKKCSSKNWICGVPSSWGIPGGMVVYQATRILMRPDGRSVFLQPPEYGKAMTRDEADRLNIETGRVVPYGRNLRGFVMSRAARKRGMVAKDGFYLQRAAAGRRG